MNDTNQPTANRVRSAYPRIARWAPPPALFLMLALSPWHAIAQAPQFTQIQGGQIRIATRLSTAATDTITQNDCGKIISYSNPVATAVALPVATSLSSGCWLDVQNTSAGPLTITPNTSTLDGASSLVLSSNQGVRIVDSTDQYLTQRGQGSAGGVGSGSGAIYAGDGSTMTLIGTTFAVNTAAVASRVTAAQGIDSTCFVSSGSSSTYTGVMRGNALTTYADGMRIIAEIDTTSAGGAVTLDCGAGPKTVYQYDGASTPLASQWPSGGQILLVFGGALSGGAGGWRILSGGGTGSNGTGGSTGGTTTPVAVTSTFDLPIGGMNYNASGCLPDWDVTAATYPYCFAYSSGRLPGLYLGNAATPSASKSLTWPSNWDNTTPVNVLITWTGSYSDNNSMKIAASFACVTSSLSNLTDATFGTPASSPTLSNTYFFHNTTITNVNANSCAPGQLGVLKIARDNTIAANSADPLGIVGVAIQWTSH